MQQPVPLIQPVVRRTEFDRFVRSGASGALPGSLHVHFRTARGGAVCEEIVDWMVAGGIERPKKPYLFLHEYKKAHGGKNPEGQLLMEMVAAQNQNNDHKPIYGAYIYGFEWRFAVLEEKQYAVSKIYALDQETDLQACYWVLARAKKYMDEAIG